jgi:hypothetical protein
MEKVNMTAQGASGSMAKEKKRAVQEVPLEEGEAAVVKRARGSVLDMVVLTNGNMVAQTPLGYELIMKTLDARERALAIQRQEADQAFRIKEQENEMALKASETALKTGETGLRIKQQEFETALKTKEHEIEIALKAKQHEIEMAKLEKERMEIENDTKRAKAKADKEIKDAQLKAARERAREESQVNINGKIMVLFDPNLYVTVKSAYLKKKVLYQGMAKERRNLLLRNAGTRVKQLFVDRKHVEPNMYTNENGYDVLVYLVEVRTVNLNTQHNTTIIVFYAAYGSHFVLNKILYQHLKILSLSTQQLNATCHMGWVVFSCL